MAALPTHASRCRSAPIADRRRAGPFVANLRSWSLGPAAASTPHDSRLTFVITSTIHRHRMQMVVSGPFALSGQAQWHGLLSFLRGVFDAFAAFRPRRE